MEENEIMNWLEFVGECKKLSRNLKKAASVSFDMQIEQVNDEGSIKSEKIRYKGVSATVSIIAGKKTKKEPKKISKKKRGEIIG